MIIQKANGHVINTKSVYIHDDILLSMDFDPVKRCLTLSLRDWQGKPDDAPYTIVFHDTLGFEVSACGYWGGGDECMFDFEYVCPTKRELLPKLEDRWQAETHEILKSTRSFHEYMETLLTSHSGDRLRVVCKAIEYNKRLHDE